MNKIVHIAEQGNMKKSLDRIGSSGIGPCTFNQVAALPEADDQLELVGLRSRRGAQFSDS